MAPVRILVLLAGAALLACPERSGEAPVISTPAEMPAPAHPAAAQVDGARIAAADLEPGNWMTHGRTYAEQRFSPLERIGKSNLPELGLAWSFDLGSTRGVETTPIVVDGVMYVTASWSLVFALDAATGELLWKYDPQVPGDRGRYACCDVVNRGVAVWKGSLFVGTLDGRLVSLDAASGDVNWEVQTFDLERPYTITGAPRVVKDKVIIGNGGAEFGVRGYVTAYDAATGDQVWRFYTVPGDPSQPFEHPELEQAAATWSGEWWEVGGGGTAWDSMAYDPELDLLYVGTGNGSPWTRYARDPGGGDNLFLCSILALRPDTGKLVWHYQTTPGDNWDYTSVQHMILADLEIGGETRKVLMQAPKNGFFYVLDRANGALISAEPFVPITWASHVDRETGRPVETPKSDYRDAPSLLTPGPEGAHNWHPMSFHPGTGLVYVPAHDLQAWYTHDESFEYRPGEANLGMDLDALVAYSEDQPPVMTGHLLAWDPVAQKAAWRVAHEGLWNGGLLSTAGGLLFQGTGDGRFVAYDAATGEVLWGVRSQTGIIAPPISYSVDGEQYVAVAAGYGGGVMYLGALENAAITDHHNEGRVLAFKLGGNAPMPRNAAREKRLPEPPEVAASAEGIGQGKTFYNRLCLGCHGTSARSSHVVPDLRFLSAERHPAFEDIVLRGILSGRGMPSFGEFLTPEEAQLLRAYIVSEARKSYEEQQAERPTARADPMTMAEGSSSDLRRRYAPLLRAVAGGANGDRVAEAVVVSISGEERPWTDTGIELVAGERISVLAGGRIVLNEELDLALRPSLYLWRRIGEEGPIFKAARDTGTHTAAAAGRFYMAVAPGHWTTREGDWEGSDGEFSGLPGAFQALLVRWKGDPLEGLRALRVHAPDDPLLAEEIERLEAPPVAPPEGWEYLWFLGESEMFSAARDETLGRDAIRARPDDDAAILRKPVSLPLTPETRLSWQWKFDQLPSAVAENQLHTHDYISIAVEFENGQDLTWYWSAALPAGTHYRCPLPWWDRHETHLVVRSGSEGLGEWLGEERNVYDDYRRAVGEPPARIVAVWLIAVGAFSHSRGAADFADIVIADRSQRVPVH